jgi:hypothetical protein
VKPREADSTERVVGVVRDGFVSAPKPEADGTR